MSGRLDRYGGLSVERRRLAMAGFEFSTNVNASASAIWRVVSDIASWPSWHPRVSHCEALTPGPVGVGSRFRESSTIGGVTRPLEISVRPFEFERQHVTGGSPFTGYDAQGTWKPAPVDVGRTRVTRRVEGLGPEGERLFPERQADLIEQNELAIEALKQHIEKQTGG